MFLFSLYNFDKLLVECQGIKNIGYFQICVAVGDAPLRVPQNGGCVLLLAGRTGVRLLHEESPKIYSPTILVFNRVVGLHILRLFYIKACLISSGNFSLSQCIATVK